MEIKFTTTNNNDLLDAFDYVYSGRTGTKAKWMKKKIIEYIKGVVRQHKVAAEINDAKWVAIKEANKINIE